MNTATLECSVWSVGRGQHVQLVRHGLRRHTVDATVVSGTLVAGDDLSESAFELVIAVPGATDRPITVTSQSTRSLTLSTAGVFHQRGRPPSLWLRVSAELDLRDLRELTGHGQLTVLADLNLNPHEASE